MKIYVTKPKKETSAEARKRAKQQEVLRERVCADVGCNVFGRLEYIAKLAEERNDGLVRHELQALLKFYPPR